jgi:hypothetical protein
MYCFKYYYMVCSHTTVTIITIITIITTVTTITTITTVKHHLPMQHRGWG